MHFFMLFLPVLWRFFFFVRVLVFDLLNFRFPSPPLFNSVFLPIFDCHIILRYWKLTHGKLGWIWKSRFPNRLLTIFVTFMCTASPPLKLVNFERVPAFAIISCVIQLYVCVCVRTHLVFTCPCPRMHIHTLFGMFTSAIHFNTIYFIFKWNCAKKVQPKRRVKFVFFHCNVHHFRVRTNINDILHTLKMKYT